MQRIDPSNEKLSMHKLNSVGWTDMYEWLENTCNEFCKEQAIEERTFLVDVEKKLYDEFHKSFFIIIPNLLFLFLI